jgi:REP element-mobilizing transposase RayT
MSMARPTRLDGVSYTGHAAYFVTTCTLHRRKAFHDVAFGREVAALLIAYAARYNFAVSAYCLMPDHAHVLATARTCEAPLRELVRIWKQVSGFRWQARHGGRLWQAGYFDHILREGEPELSVARYIIENPVRAGLAAAPQSYPLTGSSRYTIDEIADAVQLTGGRSRWHG